MAADTIHAGAQRPAVRTELSAPRKRHVPSRRHESRVMQRAPRGPSSRRLSPRSRSRVSLAVYASKRLTDVHSSHTRGPVSTCVLNLEVF